jgi:glycosyltransferase involved in cell wall biosynthesis
MATMNKNPLISAIIPVYNVEKYLSRCLDSVLAQTFKDYEIICVNDGSPDNSAKILADYASEDPRIKIVNQTNQGLSMARNNGLKASSGQYIYFLDSDDFLHPQLLEIAYSFITKHNGDWLIFKHDEQLHKAFKKANNDTSFVYCPPLYKDITKISYKTTDNPLKFYRRKFGFSIRDYIWAKLYKRELLNDIEFIPGIQFEDTPHTVALLKKHPKTVLLNEGLYYYMPNPQSIVNLSHKNLLKTVSNRYTGLLFIYEVYKKAPKNEFNFVAKNVILKYLKDQYHLIRKADTEQQPELWRLFTEELLNLDSKNFIGFKWRRFALWLKFKKMIRRYRKNKMKVGLLTSEFFGGAGTAIGGYGALARKYIAKYIPNDNIQIDVLLFKGKNRFCCRKHRVDNVDCYELPKRSFFAKMWLKKQNYDIYLSIELQDDYVLKKETNCNKKLILWIQDPRPLYEWTDIQSCKLMPETTYYNQAIYNLVHNWYKEGRVKFISQAYYLNQKAIDLYHLPENTPIKYLPNPIDIDYSFEIKNCVKKNNIIFLGRNDTVKRGWLFCEIAKRMPQYQFYLLGKSGPWDKEKMDIIMKPYQNIPNLHFAGHVDGKEKEQYLKEAKILVNTSIHEALPVSFLEALSYGTVLVSNSNPDNLTSKFGIWTDYILGDGFDKVDLYVNAIEELMQDEERTKKLSEEAIKYIKEVHNVSRFVNDLRQIIYKELGK